MENLIQFTINKKILRSGNGTVFSVSVFHLAWDDHKLLKCEELFCKDRLDSKARANKILNEVVRMDKFKNLKFKKEVLSLGNDWTKKILSKI